MNFPWVDKELWIALWHWPHTNQILPCEGFITISKCCLIQLLLIFFFFLRFHLFISCLPNQIGNSSKTKGLYLGTLCVCRGSASVLAWVGTGWIFTSSYCVLFTEPSAGRQFLDPPSFLNHLSWFSLAWLRDWPWMTSLILSTGTPDVLRVTDC